MFLEWRGRARLVLSLFLAFLALSLGAACARRGPAANGDVARPRGSSAVPVATESASGEAIFEEPTIERGRVDRLVERFFFGVGETKLSAETVAAMERVAARLNERAYRRKAVVVEGHSDAVGSREENLTLSIERAEAIAEALVDHGVAASRVHSRGFGSTRPLAPERRPDGTPSPEARARNRRVEIVFDERRR